MAEYQIFDFFTAKAIGSFWETLYSNRIPYLGTSLFPAKRMVGLKLSWIKGYDQLPVMLMPSAFDAKPTLRDRGGISTTDMKMPFFRESMRIGEEDRQQLLTLMAAGGEYTRAIIDKLYDDIANLVDSATLNPEVMRFELLQTAKISISSPNEAGIDVAYNYNYDPQGKWAANNIIELLASEYWGEEEANPIANILAVKRRAAAKGIVLTRAIVSPELWAKLIINPSIGKDIYPLGINASISESELQSYILRKTGINFTVYEKMYKSFDGTDKSFMMSDRVIFLSNGSLGNTYFGTTPEEADLMSGNADADVSIVGGGIAVLTKKESLPVNIITSVSEIVLPSYEKMDSVFVLIADAAE